MSAKEGTPAKATANDAIEVERDEECKVPVPTDDDDDTEEFHFLESAILYKTTRIPKLPTLPQTVKVVALHGRFCLSDKVNWLLPKGTIVIHGKRMHSTLASECRVTEWINDYGTRDGYTLQEVPDFTFCPEDASLPHHGESYGLKVPEWMLSRKVLFAHQEVPESILEHAAKALYDEIQNRKLILHGSQVPVHISADSRPLAGKFIAAALQGGWSYLPLELEDMIDIAKIVYGYKIESLYPEMLPLFTKEVSPSRVAAVAAVPDPTGGFAKLARGMAIAFSLLGKGSKAVNDELVQACVALDQSRKRKRV